MTSPPILNSEPKERASLSGPGVAVAACRFWRASSSTNSRFCCWLLSSPLEYLCQYTRQWHARK